MTRTATLPFADRREAGRVLGEHLSRYANREDVIVLGLPRGGTEVAAEVARALHAPLDVFIVRKLGCPWQPELAFGAIASGGARVLNDEIIRSMGVDEKTLERVTEQERRELERREKAYRGDRAPLALRGRTVILVDDGLATGATMAAAIKAARRHEPRELVAAVPVAASEVCEKLADDVDEMICPFTPEAFFSVGQWYQEFPQSTDEEVRELLAQQDEGSAPDV